MLTISLNCLLKLSLKERILTHNLKDEIARGAVVTDNGELFWPNPNPPKLDAGKAQKKPEEVKKTEEGPKDMFN